MNVRGINDVARWIIHVSETLDDLELGAKDCAEWNTSISGVRIYGFDDGSKIFIAKGEAIEGFLKARLKKLRKKAAKAKKKAAKAKKV